MRVLVADDNALVRRGVINIVVNELGLQICGEASDGSEAIRKTSDLQPDLILLDVSMPGINGFDTARVLRRNHPSAKILIMSQHDPIPMLPHALQVGADGCVDKAKLRADLGKAIQAL